MYIVTGGAGFIGGNLTRELVRIGHRVLVVDDLADRDQVEDRLRDCAIVGCLDKELFIEALRMGQSFGHVAGLFHQGACADTTCTDRWRLCRDNYGYSATLLDWAVAQRVPFVYASSAAVYGPGRRFAERPENEQPLNAYAWSKLLFDRLVRRRGIADRSTVVGLRYFNVYGPGEDRKGPMASMVYQLWRQLADTGVARIFEGTGGFADGEQRRDFIHVSDVVKANLHFMQCPPATAFSTSGRGAVAVSTTSPGS